MLLILDILEHFDQCSFRLCTQINYQRNHLYMFSNEINTSLQKTFLSHVLGIKVLPTHLGYTTAISPR